MTETQPADVAELNPSSPYAREAQTFPRLTEEMAERIARYGTEERLPDGTMVFEQGQRGVDLFFGLDGRIEILDVDEHGHPTAITTHGVRQFTVEMDLFNDREQSSSPHRVSAMRDLWPK